MTKSSKLTITKTTGVEEPFDSEKVYRSLVGSGASGAVARDVISQLMPELKQGISTRKLYRLAHKMLRRMDKPSGMRYVLKNAIYALGPTGYPFEMFVARLFEAQGYKTKVGRIISGKCVRHEVDVIATNAHSQIMMECKFHKNAKQTSDVKTAMYVESRFRDIARELRKSGSRHKFTGALVTNTRLTSEALKYCQCTGLMSLSWKNPAGRGIEKLIETTKAYPVTVLPSVSREPLAKLLKHGLVLATDIQGKDPAVLSRRTGIDARVMKRIHEQASAICANSGKPC